MFRLLGSAAGQRTSLRARDWNVPEPLLQLRIFSSSVHIFRVLAFTIFRISEFQGSRELQGSMFQGCRVEGLQDSRFHGSKIPGSQGSRFQGSRIWLGLRGPGFQRLMVFQGCRAQSSRGPGFQSLRLSAFQGSRISEFEGSFQGFQGFRASGFNQVPGFQNSKVPGFQSSSVPGFQGSRVAGLQGSKVPGFQGLRVPGFQGFRVSGFQGSRVPGFRFRILGSAVGRGTTPRPRDWNPTVILLLGISILPVGFWWLWWLSHQSLPGILTLTLIVPFGCVNKPLAPWCCHSQKAFFFASSLLQIYLILLINQPGFDLLKSFRWTNTASPGFGPG